MDGCWVGGWVGGGWVGAWVVGAWEVGLVFGGRASCIMGRGVVDAR